MVFGTVSTLNDYEGLHTVIAALRLIEDPVFRLLVVGDGPARPRLQALAEPLGDRVVFTGRVPHARVREHLAALDVFVVPRAATPVTVVVPPIKPLEALAVGVPVLASDLPPLVEIVCPGSFGEVAAADDPAAWADQMASLGYAPDHVRSLGERARAFVARERTWAATLHRYDTAYSSAVRH
ncbi:MAG: glycosyltransferase [Actinobacteria bacterium]|nr:glycosyltransferase [Actinomycetota bacterium]